MAVPRNRHDVDRAEKVEEILQAAERVLMKAGFGDLSFAALAEELGLARGALYWYFPSKDELFVAAAARIFSGALSNPPVRAGYARRITWAVDQLAALQPLNMALHDRARQSEAAARLEEAIQQEMCARLREVLRPHVRSQRLEAVAQTIVVFVQGLLTTPLPGPERNRRLRFLLNELVT
jgi:AcrR family transcriptional regulator